MRYVEIQKQTELHIPRVIRLRQGLQTSVAISSLARLAGQLNKSVCLKGQYVSILLENINKKILKPSTECEKKNSFYHKTPMYFIA